MKREKHQQFFLLLFLAGASTEGCLPVRGVVAFQFADGSITRLPWPKTIETDKERPRHLRGRVHYGLICSPLDLAVKPDGQ